VWCPSGVLVNLWWCNCIHWWAKGPKVDLVVCLYPSPTLAYPYKVPLFPFVLSLSPFDRVPLGVWRWGYTSTLVSEPRSSVSIPSSKHSPIYKKLIPTRVTAWVLAWVWKNDLRPLWRIVSSWELKKKKRKPKMSTYRSNSMILWGEEGEQYEALPHPVLSRLKKKERNPFLRDPLMKKKSLGVQGVEEDNQPLILRLIYRSLKANWIRTISWSGCKR